MTVDLISALITGLATVAGALVGGFLAHRAASTQSHRALLGEAYARVITEYTKYFFTESQYPPKDLLAALEIAWFLSSKKTAKVIRNLESAVALKNPDMQKCGELLNSFRAAARNEME